MRLVSSLTRELVFVSQVILSTSQLPLIIPSVPKESLPFVGRGGNVIVWVEDGGSSRVLICKRGWVDRQESVFAMCLKTCCCSVSY